MKPIIILLILIFFFSEISFLTAQEGILARRRPQKAPIPNTYYILPWYLHITGIGNLFGGVVGIANLFDVGTNVAGFTFQNGNFRIRAYAVDDIFLLGDKESILSLTLSGGVIDIKLKELDSYEVGSDSSSTPNQVNGILLKNGVQVQARVFYDRLKFGLEAYDSKDSIRRANVGETGEETHYAGNRMKLELDLTDDRYDSRLGVRAIWIKSTRAPSGNFFTKNDSDEKFEINSQEYSVFIPLYSSDTQNHTIAYNFYLSLANNLNKDIPFNRREGNDLGGPVRMRGYPNRRFVDSNTYYYALEYRFTMIDDFGSNDEEFILSNDSFEGLQFALFKEWGQVSEFNDKSLYSNLKTDWGVGVRAILSSLVLRLDVGFSEEGKAINFVVLQPF